MAENRRALIVEDDPDGQILVAHILQQLGLAVDVASDAEQALDYLLEGHTHYRAAIIDLALPGRDGWHLLLEIKSRQQLANLPCIAVTAHHSARTREEAMRAGFRAYFSKPIQPNMMVRELEALLAA
jgi:CheY-like chemotaxis protein